ncbi:hypothetical protein Tco_1239755 [Tanacetum coccineum]
MQAVVQGVMLQVQGLKEIRELIQQVRQRLFVATTVKRKATWQDSVPNLKGLGIQYIMGTQLLQAKHLRKFLAAFQADDLDAFDYDCDEAPSSSDVLMAKLSLYDSKVLLEVPTHDTYLDNHMIDQKTENTVVQDTSSAQQEALIMSVIEEMTNQVAKCNEVDKENKIINESLTSEHERYKEQINFFEESDKFDLNDREKYIDSQLRKKHDALSVIDIEETLELAKESRLKMHAKQNDPIAKDKKLILHPLIMLP